MVQTKRDRWMLLYCLLVAATLLAVCSKSSFLYPINDWTDANAYLTSGRGMLAGRVMYRDLYEHKGPLLYALHAMCCLVQSGGFLGVYLLETLAGTLFLFAAYRLLALYNVARSAKVALPLMAAAIWASFSFQQGDSAEELSLPMLAWSLYALLNWLRAPGSERMSARALVVHGALMGCVLWLKFTLLGLYVPWVFGVLGVTFVRKGWRETLASMGWMAAGVALSTLPWLLYFGLNGAIGDWLKTYIYDNLFLYQDENVVGLAGRLRAMAGAGADWWLRNPGYSVPLTAGFLWSLVRGGSAASELHRKTGAAQNEQAGLTSAQTADAASSANFAAGPLLQGDKPLNGKAHPSGCSQVRISRMEVAFWWLEAFWVTLGVFIGGKSYVYYGLVLAVLLPLAAVPFCAAMENLLNRLPIRKEHGAADRTRENAGMPQPSSNATREECAAVAVWWQRRAGKALQTAVMPLTALLAAVTLCLLTGSNVRDLGKARADTMQYRFAALVAQMPDATLLNYNFMDAGFYTACNIAPTVKYFHRTNVHLQEMVDEQARYVAEGLTDFVVARDALPDTLAQRYELIDVTQTPPDYWYRQVYLYRLRDGR